MISCPGNRNHIEATKDNFATAACRSGNRLSVSGHELSSVDLDCSGRATAKTRITQRKCAGGRGIVVEIGFDVSTSWIFYPDNV